MTAHPAMLKQETSVPVIQAGSRPLPGGLVCRPAWADEMPRVAKLFPEAARPGECFVAVRERPVERIVGAAFWWEGAGPNGAGVVEFCWGALPVLADTPVEKDFILAFMAELAARSRADLLRSADPLPEGAQARLLQGCGFEPAYRQDCYLGEWESCGKRIRQVLARLEGKAAPAGWRLVTPAPANAEMLTDLATRRHNLISAQEILAALAPSGAQSKFDPAFSALLFQGEELVGACLVKLYDGQIAIPVLVVEGTASAGLACALMFDFCQHALASQDVRQFQFRTNPELSPAMPRLARRFGCKSLGSLTVWSIALRTSGAGGAGGFNSSLHPSL